MAGGMEAEILVNESSRGFESFALTGDGSSDFGSGDYGCEHYRRRCKIRAPCCDEIFDCRHCHNESKNSLDIEPKNRHDLPRHEIKKVICSLCETEQDVQQHCRKCGVVMGNYFCAKCNFFDDDVTKKQYHCDKCGICRTGGEENFFHCPACGCCYSKVLEGAHICVEKAMHQNCPVCFEYLFDSTSDLTAFRCGHTLHLECAKEMESHSSGSNKNQGRHTREYARPRSQAETERAKNNNTTTIT